MYDILRCCVRHTENLDQSSNHFISDHFKLKRSKMNDNKKKDLHSTSILMLKGTLQHQRKSKLKLLKRNSLRLIT